MYFYNAHIANIDIYSHSVYFLFWAYPQNICQDVRKSIK